MGDSYGDPQQNTRNYESNRGEPRGGFKGGRGGSNRGPGGREGGGFRIRLSDNEMRAARSLQEAFNLRSTVAVLGFAIRTLAQMLEDGKLEELVAQARSQASSGSNRKPDGRQGSKRNNRFEGELQNAGREDSKPNPFARPEKPQPVEKEPEDETQKIEKLPESDNQNQDIDLNETEETKSEEQKVDTQLLDSNEETPSQSSTN